MQSRDTMIEGVCHTNLDDFKLGNWPTVFCALPRVGDYVEEKVQPGRAWRLRVVSVTHKWNGTIEVELHR